MYICSTLKMALAFVFAFSKSKSGLHKVTFCHLFYHSVNPSWHVLRRFGHKEHFLETKQSRSQMNPWVFIAFQIYHRRIHSCCRFWQPVHRHMESFNLKKLEMFSCSHLILSLFYFLEGEEGGEDNLIYTD